MEARKIEALCIAARSHAVAIERINLALQSIEIDGYARGGPIVSLAEGLGHVLALRELLTKIIEDVPLKPPVQEEEVTPGVVVVEGRPALFWRETGWTCDECGDVGIDHLAEHHNNPLHKITRKE